MSAFVTADLHFGHSKMYDLPFRKEDGTPVRPFASAEEADEEMICSLAGHGASSRQGVRTGRYCHSHERTASL